MVFFFGIVGFLLANEVFNLMNDVSYINGHTKILGLLGSGISYSLSPLIHNYSIKCLNLNQVYLPFDIQGNFPSVDFFKTMWDIGCIGFNVTVPWKESVAQLFSVSGLSSVNTIYRGHDGWQVASTDGPGFEIGLDSLGFECRDFDQVVFLGNGGAALGIHEHLSKVAPHLDHVVLRRSTVRDDKWKKNECSTHILDFKVDCLSQVLKSRQNSLLLQCTNAPMYGENLSEFNEAIKFLKGAFVDLLYSKTSSLLDQAKAQGIPAQDGLGMLVGQALLSQDLWWGRNLGFEGVYKFLSKEVKIGK